METGFFIGSGFSKSAGLPIGNEITNKILEITEEDFNKKSKYISDNTCPFDVHKKLLDNYKAKTKCTNYEEYYDFVLKFSSHVNSITPLVQDEIENILNYNYEISLGYVNKYIIVLQYFIMEYLNKIPINDFNTYSPFLQILKNKKNSHYNIFSLNHDLLLEYLFEKNDINFSDGFNKSESIPEFSNTFISNIIILKLHGSINYFRKFDSTTVIKAEKLKFGQKFNRNILPNGSFAGFDPFFLTGKDTKQWFSEEIKIDNNPPIKFIYYNDIFKKFIEQLNKIDIFYFIGYSFGDQYINDNYLVSFFNSGKKVVVFEKNQNSALINLQEKYNNIQIIPKYLEDIELSDFKT